MSRARHQDRDDRDDDDREERARGGMIDDGREADEEREMEDGHKKGGRVRKERRRGGSVEHGEGRMGRRRMDRPGRKRGGGVGADMNPLTTASKTKDAEGHRTGESGEAGQDHPLQ